MIEFNGSEIVINENIANDIMDFATSISGNVLSGVRFKLAPVVIVNDNSEEVCRLNFECTSETPAAYIVTSNRGKEYLVFAGSVEHQNAAMFGYKMRALYE